MSLAALSLLFESKPGITIESKQLLNVRGCGPIPDSWLINLPNSAHVTCVSCGEPHGVAVAWDEARRELGSYCIDGGGWTPIAPSAVERFAVDHGRLLLVIATAFGAIGAHQVLAPNLCWRLGEIQIEGKGVALIGAREMNDPRQSVATAETLRHQFKSGPGLVLCGAPPVPDLGLMPRGFKAVCFDRVMSADGERVASDQLAVAFLLGLRKRRRGEHGSTEDHPRLIPYVDARRSGGRACSSPTAEARYLLAEASAWASPSRPLPQVDALRMMIFRRKTNR